MVDCSHVDQLSAAISARLLGLGILPIARHRLRLRLRLLRRQATHTALTDRLLDQLSVARNDPRARQPPLALTSTEMRPRLLTRAPSALPSRSSPSDRTQLAARGALGDDLLDPPLNQQAA
jgi:hypothetical protein